MGLVGGPDKDRPKFTQTASESFESGDPNNQLTSPDAADLLLIPDGAGGLLYAGSSMDYGAGSSSSVMVKRFLNPRESDAGPSFTLPSLEYVNQLVVGENDTAYAAGAYDGYYGARIVAFDINGGGKKWDYDPPYGEPYDAWADIVAALPGGGVAGTVGYWQEPRITFTLDASGVRTDVLSPVGQTYLSFSGVPSDVWYSATPNTTSTAVTGTVSLFVDISNTSQNLQKDRQEKKPLPPLPKEKEDAIWNAQKAVIALLSQPSCWTIAQVRLFNKFLDWNDVQVTTQSFISYLSTSPGFFDGTISSYPYKNAKCGEHRWYQRLFCQASPGDVAWLGDWEQGATALAVTPSFPFKSFWQPEYKNSPTPEPTNCIGASCLGIWPGSGIDSANFGANLTNESNLVHEALHGMTGKYDDQMQEALGIKTQRDSQNISLYIRDKVLSPCTAVH
jgi:hypothetical protein